MDTIVIAGGVPKPEEPLYPYTQGQPKALLDVCGKPMIQWVLDALNEAEKVDDVIVIGLSDSSTLTCPKVKDYLPGEGSMVDNVRGAVRRVLELNPDSKKVLMVSSDIPAITAEMVNWLIDTVSESDEDIYYNVITRQVMEARYPESKRSFTRLKDVDVCGGDMNVARAALATEREELWERIVAARKNAFKQAALIGFDTLLLLLFRQITLEGAVKKVTKRLNLTGRAILCPYAEVAMDVDKPHQLEILRADLAKRTTP